MSTAATAPQAEAVVQSRTAASSSATASTRSARCAAAPGRRDRHLDAARPLARRAAHRLADRRGRTAASSCARSCARNRVRDGLVYLQVTRGAARRDHALSDRAVESPALVVTARDARCRAATPRRRRDGRRGRHRAGHPLGASAISRRVAASAERARQAGGARGGRVRGLVRRRDGFVTEGASTNAWIVTADGAFVTRPGGRVDSARVTRASLLDVQRDAGSDGSRSGRSRRGGARRRRSVHPSATTIAMPVVAIDGAAIGDGRPGRSRSRAAARISRSVPTHLNDLS